MPEPAERAADPPAGSWSRSVLAVIARPSLWWTAVRMVRRFGVPSRAYMGFRMVTAYGDARAVPAPADTVAYLEWLRAWDATIRR